MNAKTSVFVNCLEAIIYLLLYNLHNCTFNNLNTGTVNAIQKKFVWLHEMSEQIKGLLLLALL